MRNASSGFVAVLLAILATFCLAPAAAAAEAKCGVVLLHGKHGSPDRYIAGLAQSLREAGYMVATPEMPWSRRRAYNAGFLEGLAEVDAAVKELRAKGAPAVVVGGHSLGANAALAYAARSPGLAGVICLAPGHSPESGRMRDQAAESVARAKALVAEGKGERVSTFADLNMGKTFDLTATAAAYLSYFDPDGPAVMPRSAAMLNPPVPVLWIAGAADPLSRSGPGYGFDKAPAHPKSRYAVVQADHLGTPEAAKAMVLEWLGALAR
ncbi:MAG: alpha/beta hydrolase [Desulfovibrio sp.]|jgi:pimeloyl-ACP methyl ester carboxylesterase|nr:alpha/beta hydrolase [Desulfovibrio sp.]